MKRNPPVETYREASEAQGGLCESRSGSFFIINLNVAYSWFQIFI